MQVRSLSGAPHRSADHHGAWWRTAWRVATAHVIMLGLMAVCLALAAWPPAAARAAAQSDACVAGLPANLTAELQPLLQALGDATGQLLDCGSLVGTDASGADPPSQHQQDLRLIAEALALLAMADPGYGYSAPGTGYAAPGYGATAPPPAPATAAAQASAAPPGDAQASTTCGSPPDSPPNGGQGQ